MRRDLIEVEDPGAVWLACGEAAVAHVRRGRLEQLAPCLQAAVQHRLAVVPEPAQEKPQARGHRAANVVVHDDRRRIVDARNSHRGLELLAGGQRVPAGSFARDVVELDKGRARDVSLRVFLRAFAPGKVPAEVDDANVGIADVLMQPSLGDQRTERAHACGPAVRVS